jgi:two-component system CheB/CheR fusion protein
MVVFAQHNLIRDPPFTKLDLISCRNLLIYLQPELQKRILELFSFALNPGGLLFLGSSESIGDMSDVFEVVNQKWRIYRFSGQRQSSPRVAQLSSPLEARTRPGVRPAPWSSTQVQQVREGERLLDRFLQAVSEDYVPLSIVVNEQMEVLHTLGDTSGLLRLPSGKMQNDITRMTGRDLGIPLSTGLQKVFKTGKEVVYTSIHLQPDLTVDLRIKPLSAKKGQEPLAAVFIQTRTETREPREENGSQAYDIGHEAQQRIEDLEQELQFTKENLQATIEELETSNEELQATNEELLASNEELQSTNEELQSVNEELHTLNAEYQQKINQLTELNNDMDNLLASADIATLFLDDGLEVRRFTPLVTELFNIMEADLGRPLHYISHRLKDCNPLEMARTVLASRSSLEKEVQSVDNRWYLLRAKPYLIGQEHPSGVVVSFTDISQVKQTRADLEHQAQVIQSVFRAAPVGIGMVVGRVIQWINPKLARMTGYEEGELVGRDTRLLYASEEEYLAVGRAKQGLSQSREIGSIKTAWRRRDGSVFDILLSFSPLNVGEPESGVTFSAMELHSPAQVQDALQDMTSTPEGPLETT